MSQDTLDNYRIHCRGSPTPFEQSIWNSDCFELKIRLQRITNEGKTQEFS